MNDYYEILGIPSTATTAEINQVFKQLAFDYYQAGNARNREAEEHFKKILEAFVLLTNPEERASYDRKYYEIKKLNNKQEIESEFLEIRKVTNVKHDDILASLKAIRKSLIGLERSYIDELALYNAINDVLSEANIEFLNAAKDTSSNRLIIKEVKVFFKALAYPQIEQLIPKLQKIAMADIEAINDISSYQRRKKFYYNWTKYKVYIAFSFAGAVFGLFILMVMFNQEPNSKRQVVSSRTNELGKKSQISTETRESIDQLRMRLTNEGWFETVMKNGELPECYSSEVLKSSIDNYIEVRVGRGTDVVIKVVNVTTQKSIRKVFVNGGSTFRIRNIPEGLYYLKIAYGKDWFSKAEDGKCLGKFVRNSLFEKGEDLLDFRLEPTNNGYSIPSYKLSLDVISTNTMNSFNSQNISEGEFNR